MLRIVTGWPISLHIQFRPDLFKAYRPGCHAKDPLDTQEQGGMNSDVFYIIVGIGILDIIIKLIPWGSLGDNKKHHDKSI